MSQYDDAHLNYKLVWSDEFDYEGQPDDTKWSYQVGGHGWGNRELQYYTEGKNAYVKDGKLTITARKEAVESMKYTSARLTTHGKGDWRYGKIEVRAKLPSGVGTWPAIWMMPSESHYGKWPLSGEIDIMEHVGSTYGEILGTVHTGTYNHTKGTQVGEKVNVSEVSEQFYVYSIEWLPDKIKFYVNEDLFFVYEPRTLTELVTENEWPFDQPFHLIINLAIGGTLGGGKGVDDQVFPQELVIDYVRVYQAKPYNQGD